MGNLIVSEIFGPTWQGEGVSVGRLCYFLRLGGCNQHCKWCDTAYTWRFTDTHPHNDNIVYDKTKELTTMETKDVLDLLLKVNTPFLVITGGEPMLQSREVWRLVDELLHVSDTLKRVEIETAGTIFDDNTRQLAHINGVHFNVSPKLENSGNDKELRYKFGALAQFNEIDNSIFKFVITGEEDFEEINQIIDDIKISKDRVWCMVEGKTNEEQEAGMDKFVPLILKEGWNFTPRLHVQIWGNRRGV